MTENLVFGIRPVVEAIEAGKQIEKLYIRKGAEGQLMTELRDLCLRHRIRTQEVPVEKLNRLTRGNHQGVVAQISPIGYVELNDILERVPEDETPLIVLFDGVTDVRNFGAIARSAECAGAHGLIVPLKNAAPVNSEAIRSSAGALTAIPVCRVGSIRNTLKALQAEGYQVVGATEKKPQAALRRGFPQAYGTRYGRRGYGHFERGAEALRRTAGDPDDRQDRVAQRLGGSGSTAVRNRTSANRLILPSNLSTRCPCCATYSTCSAPSRIIRQPGIQNRSPRPENPPAGKKTIVHPIVGEVTLSQSRRARRISLCVRPSGPVRLSYPYGVSTARALEFLESRIEWIQTARDRIAERLAQQPPRPTLSPEEELRRREQLRREAMVVLPSRVAELAVRTGLQYRSVTIRATRSKWGSCNGRNDLSLSLYLMTLPEHLRDFVILHELCHTVHHDHSPRFHALLDRLVGVKKNSSTRS